MNVPGQHPHRVPANFNEEQQFMQMAVAASIQEARDAGIDVSTSLDAPMPAGVRDMQSPFSPFSPASISNSNIGTPAGHLGRYNSSFSDPVVFSAHVEPLNALLEDCSRLKELSKDATSYREGCTKLGAVGDEIKLAANNAAQKVGNEDQSLYLSKIFASCHKEVSLATTLIEVYGRYSKVKKYAKVFRKWAIKEKLSDAEQRLVTWLNAIWEFVRDHSTVEFKHKFHELVQMDSMASGAPFPDHRSNPDFTPSHHSTPREGSAISGLAPLPHHHFSGASALDQLLSSRASEPVGLFSGDDERRDQADQELDIMFTSAGSRRGFHDLLRTSVGRTGKGPPRRQCRKLAVAHWMAKPVTAVLYVEPVTHNPQHGTQSDRDSDYVSGTVWWWAGGYMHVHDIPANNTSSRLPPADKVSAKSAVRRLALDCNKQFVWAGHENGEVSIWREATNKLACVTSRELSKDISNVQCIEPLSGLVVAVGCEGGRVVILKLLGQYCDSEHSQMAQILTSTGTAHDDKKQIVKVGELVALAGKTSGAIGVQDDDLACMPPLSQKDGPLQLRSVIRGLFGGRSVARGASVSSVEKEGLQPHTPSSRADSFTGELAEPGTPLQQPATGSANSSQTTHGLPVVARRDGSTAGPPRPLLPSTIGTPFASIGQSVTASGQLSEASMVVVPTPRGSAEHATLSQVPASQLSGVPSLPSEDLGVRERAPRRRFRLDEEEKSTLLRKVTKVGQDLKLLIGGGHAADMDVGGRAHDNRIECMTAVMPYIFTASAANQACDAQIRMWVQSHEKESHQFGLHDTYHCRENRATRCMCVLPWPTDSVQRTVDTATSSTTVASSKPWRILTGHDSGNILMFDPSLPHLKPILTIKFTPFVNIHPVDIAVFSPLRLLSVTRVDGTVQLMSMITPASRIMKSAIDPLHPNAMDGVVSLEVAGDVLRLHDRRIDHVSSSSTCCDMVTGTLRGNVSMWPRRLFFEKASEAGIMEAGTSMDASISGYRSGHGHGGDYGDPIFRVTTQKDAIRSSTALDDQDLDIVNAKDIKLHRHLGNGAFGTVREGTLHYTTVAVKILKEGEVMGALGSLAQAGDADRQDIRRGLEVKILKGIRHPNVLFFRGICVNPPMIITELCEHGSVSDVIQLTVRISKPNSTISISAEKQEAISEHMQWAGRVRLMLDAAKGMLYLHNKDLLHCDLKSLNLLIDKTWTCKVADFGLSRNVSGKQSGRNVPAANNPMWQAPEVIANPSHSSKAGDVYSFGIIMWELLMMQRPWSGTHLSMIQHLVQSGTRPEFPRNLSELPGARPGHLLPAAEEYIKLMERCWDERVEVRPNFEQIVEELEAVEQTAAVHRTKSKQQQKRWQETVREAYAKVQSQPITQQFQDQARGGMRSSALSSMAYSSTSHRGSLPHVTSATSSGNLSPLSIGMTPRQAMDLDAGHAVDVAAGSTSSPHTTPPSNSGEHSMSYSTTQRNSAHDVSDHTDPDTTNEADHLTPRDRFQRNLGVFSAKDGVPPLELESAAKSSTVLDTGGCPGHGQLMHQEKRRSTEDGTAHDNMLSFDDYLPDGVMGMQDGLGTLEGSEHMELRPGLKNPRASNASSDDENSRMADAAHSRFDASSSEQPVSQVHITIGNSIQERFQEETMSSAAFRSGHPHLDSIPEGNTQTSDTMEGHVTGGAADADEADTLDMLVRREQYTIAPNSAEGEVLGAVVRPKRPPAPAGPHPFALVSAGEEEGRMSDGMYRVSMDHSAMDSLPVLDSQNPLESHTNNGSTRRIFNPALQGAEQHQVSNRAAVESAAVLNGLHPPQSDAEAEANRALRHVAINDPLEVSGLAGGSPIASSSSNPDPLGPESPGKFGRHQGEATPSGGLQPARSGSGNTRGDTLSARFDLLADPTAVAMASPFVPQPLQGTTSSTAVSTDASPTLPPLSSAFVSATDIAALHRGTGSPREQGTPIAAGVWSPFDVEPASVTQSSSSAHGAAAASNAAVSPLDAAHAVRQASSNTYVPPEHHDHTDSFEAPPLDEGQFPSFRVNETALPVSAVQASPFDKEPSAPSVALHSGSVSQAVAHADCDTAPFFRPGSASGATGSQPSASSAYKSADSSSMRFKRATNPVPERSSLSQVPEALNEVTAGASRIPSVSGASTLAHSQSRAARPSGAAEGRSTPGLTTQPSPSPPLSPRNQSSRDTLAVMAAAAAQHMSENGQKQDATPPLGGSIASHRLPVLIGATSSVASHDGGRSPASRTASMERSAFDHDPSIAPQISQYVSPFLKEASPAERSTHSSERNSDWHSSSRGQVQGHRTKSSQDRQRHRTATSSDRHLQGRSAASSVRHSSRGNTHKATSQASAASTSASQQPFSPAFTDAVVPRFAGAFDGPEPPAAQASLTGGHGTAHTHFTQPATDAVSPMFVGAFDVEQPSAHAADPHAPFNLSPVQDVGGQDAVAPVLIGAFDVEPESARGPDVTFGLRPVPGVMDGAMVPVLPSTFDKEPPTASASGRGLPVTNAVALDLPSLFDHEPPVAQQASNGAQLARGVRPGVFVPDDVPEQPAQPHALPGSAATRAPASHHSHHQNGSGRHDTATPSHHSSNGVSPLDRLQPYAAAYSRAPPPPPVAQMPDDRLSAFDVDPSVTSTGHHMAMPYPHSPPIHPGATEEFRRSLRSSPSLHGSRASSVNGSAQQMGSTPRHRRTTSGQSTGGIADPASDLAMLVGSHRPQHRRTASGNSWQGAPDTFKDIHYRAHDRVSTGTPPLPPDAFAELRAQYYAQSPPSSTRHASPSDVPFAQHALDPDSGGATVFSKSHHQSPFFSGNSLSPEELLAVTREAADQRSARRNTSTPSFCEPSTPYEREDAIQREHRSSSQQAPASDVPLGAAGRQLSPVAVTTLQVTPHIRLRTVESSASSTSSLVQPSSSRPPNATTRPSRRLSGQPGSVRMPPNATARPRRALSHTASSRSHSDRSTPLFSSTTRYSLHSPSFIPRSVSGSPHHPGTASSHAGVAGGAPRSLQNVPEAGYIGYAYGSRPHSEGGSWNVAVDRELSYSDPAAAMGVWRTLPSLGRAVHTTSSALYSPVDPGLMQQNSSGDRAWFESWTGSRGMEGSERDP